MTKHEFMARLASELHKRNVADAADVIEEYEQHFAFKLADGYSEEEIAAKLGSPEELAAQFESTDTAKKVGGSKALAVTGLCFADLFAGLFFVLLAGFGLVMAAAALCFAALAVCLLGGWNIAGLIPAMPYWCGAILALSFAALTVPLVVGCVYYAAFLRQLVRSFGRFQHNALASASGEAALPALAISPQFSAKTRRRLLRAVLRRVRPVRRKPPVLARVGLVPELRCARYVRSECGRAAVLRLHQCRGLSALQMPGRSAQDCRALAVRRASFRQSAAV